jgi:hypothetical protein
MLDTLFKLSGRLGITMAGDRAVAGTFSEPRNEAAFWLLKIFGTYPSFFIRQTH